MKHHGLTPAERNRRIREYEQMIDDWQYAKAMGAADTEINHDIADLRTWIESLKPIPQPQRETKERDRRATA